MSVRRRACPRIFSFSVVHKEHAQNGDVLPVLLVRYYTGFLCL